MAEKKTFTPEEFNKAYQELCEKMGHRIAVVPQYMARDDGTFSTVLQMSIQALKKEPIQEA
jgi:hypothetical protein